MEIQWIELERLHPHPLNSNEMSEGMFKKLVGHIRKTGCYPPVVVRKRGQGEGGEEEGYEIIDGHHRVRALAQVGVKVAECVVWEMDDAQAALYLATLNRLQGRDDPFKRGALLEELRKRMGEGVAALAALLPEDRKGVERLLGLQQPPPAPRLARSLEDMPVAVHFFLKPAERQRVERAVRQAGNTREEGLLAMVEAWERSPGQ